MVNYLLLKCVCNFFLTGVCASNSIFASQGLRFGSPFSPPFSPPLADLEYISRFNISLVTATSTRIQSEDVLHGAHVIDEM